MAQATGYGQNIGTTGKVLTGVNITTLSHRGTLAFVSELTQGSLLGTYCHEFGHLLGLFDLYTMQWGTIGELGNFSVMSYGEWLGGGIHLVS